MSVTQLTPSIWDSGILCYLHSSAVVCIAASEKMVLCSIPLLFFSMFSVRVPSCLCGFSLCTRFLPQTKSIHISLITDSKWWWEWLVRGLWWTADLCRVDICPPKNSNQGEVIFKGKCPCQVFISRSYVLPKSLCTNGGHAQLEDLKKGRWRVSDACARTIKEEVTSVCAFQMYDTHIFRFPVIKLNIWNLQIFS